MKERPNNKSKKKLPKPVADAKFREFFQLTSDMVQVFKADGTVLEANPAWFHALEYGEKDISCVSIFNIIRGDQKKESEEIFLAVLRDGRPRKFQATLISKTGMEIMAEGTVSRVPAAGKQDVLFGIFHDVTQHRHYERLKDEFIGTISHELRTPLTVVREGVSQVRDELFGPVPDDQKALLDMVLQNSDRLGRIIEELLDVSKLEAGRIHLHRRSCDLVAVIREVTDNFRTLALQKKLEIFTEFVPESIRIYIDRDKIVQVMNHLMNNSLRFTEEGHIKIDVRGQQGFVECKVSDTGKGISSEDLPRAFQNFSQFEREAGPGDRGTGLGLSICKKLIELHHGRVKIESSPSNGTTATFLLPQYTSRDLFKETITEAMERCHERGCPLSVIIFDILDFEALEKRFGVRSMDRVVTKMEKVINDTLRRVADIAVKDTKAIMVLLPDTPRESALIALGRISQILEDYLFREQKIFGIELHSSVVCFPEEADTLDGIFDRIYL